VTNFILINGALIEKPLYLSMAYDLIFHYDEHKVDAKLLMQTPKMKFVLTAIFILSFFLIEAQTYIRSGKGDYNKVLYTWDGKYLRQGKGNHNTVLFTWDGKYIRQGKGNYNTVLSTWDGKYLRKGRGDYNKVLYTWDGKYIRQGKGDYNKVLYTIGTKYIRQGKGDYNPVLLTLSGEIPIAVLIFLMV